MSIWKEEKKKTTQDESKLYNQVDNFFENIKGVKNLEYREGQHTMALDIAEVIKNKEILLIEAGVGIGKSYAYLIPIIYEYQNNPEFHGFIISTSTIALQEQLEKDIKNIGNLLGIDIDVTVAKGKTNYICKKKLENIISSDEENEIYEEILKRVNENGEIDRYSFSDLDEEIWKNIHITSCNFQKCSKALECPYLLNRQNFTKNGAIICNHDLLIQSLKRDDDAQILKEPNVLVIDEAHSIEDKVRNAYKKYLDKRHIENIFWNIHHRILNSDDSIEIEQEFFYNLNGLFLDILTNAKRGLAKNIKIDSGYDECVRVNFNITNKTKEKLNFLIKRIDKLLKEVKNYEILNNDIVTNKEIDELKEVRQSFCDLLDKEKSNYVYWVEFLGKDGKFIRIMYAPKEIDKITSRLLSNPNYGKILTSATLTTQDDDYSYYAKSIGLDNIIGINVLKEFSINSPYNYQDNTLIYYGNDLPSPNDKELYLEEIKARIKELVNITNGKSLILFTSKKDMHEVYEYLKDEVDFPIYIQEDGKEKALIENFQNEENSCLLGTGTFYEGIDIKGSSLSQVIIAKLPFPIVEPVIMDKASIYTNGFKKVYLPEMLIKLKQGVGRLIRSENDTGIISILDSRMQNYDNKYDNIIKNNLPNTTITTSLDEIKEFAKQKIKSL